VDWLMTSSGRLNCYWPMRRTRTKKMSKRLRMWTRPMRDMKIDGVVVGGDDADFVVDVVVVVVVVAFVVAEVVGLDGVVVVVVVVVVDFVVDVVVVVR
jgi:hypothetical protein